MYPSVKRMSEVFGVEKAKAIRAIMEDGLQMPLQRIDEVLGYAEGCSPKLVIKAPKTVRIYR